MPRVTRQQADQHRAAIENASSRLFRERGVDGVSVSELMAAAGLTHGGFYGHFDSKEALAAVACSRAFAQSARKWRTRVASRPDHAGARVAIIDAYLSPSSRDAAGSACPAPALAADVARAAPGATIRSSYCDGIEQLLEVLDGVQGPHDPASCRRRSLADLSTLIGALLLSRATTGHALSDQVLAAARAALGATP